MRRMMSSVLVVCACLFGAAASFANTVAPSVFERDILASQYSLTTAKVLADLDDQTGGGDEMESSSNPPGYKSPGKAFVYSLIIPGAGQLYYGSKIKAAAFLGAEAASWFFYAKFHSDGEELTDEFEAFQQAHWSEDAYSDYLEWVYGHRDDDSIDAVEISHNLPSTRTQQYYEMTGKYDQFSWGWDDARLDGRGLEGVDTTSGNPYTPVDPPDTAKGNRVPSSANRLTYETMRHDANKKFDNATKMIIVASVNHLVSAVEALISTKLRNNKLAKGPTLGQIKVKATLKSYYSRRDTPYVTFTYKF